MHIKFLPHGSPRGRSGRPASLAAEYLTREKDHAGRPRDEIKVLRGDPEMTAAVADSLSFKHTYNSAVLSFHPDDKPTPEQIDKLLNEFEKTAWPGLEQDRYTWTAISHRVGDDTHIHVLTARVDLETGKSLNIAPPGWQKTYDELRDWFNYEHGWARPDDPARAKDLQSDRLEIHLKRKGLELKDRHKQKHKITEYLMTCVERGLISDRDGIIKALHDIGLETPREGKSYITVMDSKGNRLRLKGALYDAGFRPGRQDRSTNERDRGFIQERADESLRKLEKARSKRAEYNHQRYGTGSKEHTWGIGRDEKYPVRHISNGIRDQDRLRDGFKPEQGPERTVLDRAEGPEREISKSGQNAGGPPVMDISDRNGFNDRGRNLGIFGIHGGEDRPAAGDDESVKSADRGIREIAYRGSERRRQGVSHIAEGDESKRGVEAGRSKRNRIRGRVIYDGIRDSVTEIFRKIGQTIRRGYERFVRARSGFDRTIQDYERANQRIDSSNRRLRRSNSKIDRCIQQSREYNEKASEIIKNHEQQRNRGRGGGRGR